MAQGSPEQIAQAFIGHYYQQFEANRQGLGALYSAQSILTFEGERFIGTQAIVGKLTALKFNQCKIHVGSFDCQPSVANGILIFVTGNIVTEGEAQALKFSQVFHLMASGQSYYVSNDMFRLNYF